MTELEHKPSDTDTGQVEEKSTVEVMAERMSEARQETEGLSNLTPQTPTEGNKDVSTQGGSSDGDNTDVAALKILEASTGRKFESIEEFKKNYEGLNKLVGDNEVAKARKAAETLQNWEQKTGKTTPELEKLLADIAVSNATSETPAEAPKPEAKPSPEPVQPKQVDRKDNEWSKRIEQIEREVQLNALEKKYPKAIEIADVIEAVAKSRGTSILEAFEGTPELKRHLELKEKEESQRSPVVTPSNRTDVDYKTLENLGVKLATGRASEKDQINFAKEYFKTKGKPLK